MRRLALVAAAGLAAAAAAACGGGAAASQRHVAAPASPTTTVAVAAGHRLAGFSLDRQWLALAEDPASPHGCPLVELVNLDDGSRISLTKPGGATCRFGGRFWVRRGGRALGNAIVKAIWVVHNGGSAEAIKGSTTEPEVVLAHVRGISNSRGPFLGPVVAKNWLRLFARYTVGADGTQSGGEISGNSRELWTSTGTVPALGLDKQEHIVSVGADGSIAMWHAHGARYGKVPGAKAAAAAMDDATVYVLRTDAPKLDVRTLHGAFERSWPVAPRARPLLDVSGRKAVYLAGDAVHELDVETGADRVAARAPTGSTLLDAQIERRFLAYAVRGGRVAGPGRVVVVRR